MAKWPVSCALIIQPVSVKLDRETDSKQESKDFQSEIKKTNKKKIPGRPNLPVQTKHKHSH